MKAFRFTLQKLLDYKQQLLDKEKMALGVLLHQRQELEQQLEQLQRHAGKLNVELSREIAKGTTIQKIQQYKYQLNNIQMHRELLQSEIGRTNLLIENQQKVVIGITQEVSGLEKLEEKQLQEYQEMVNKQEELFMAELVSRKVSLAAMES